MSLSRREKELKYEIKTANFVAEIENDEQLTQLAKVGTIQKNTKLRMLPNGQWIPAKTLPLLQVVWGLVPAANIPAIERPEDAGTGIKRLMSAPPLPGASRGQDVPPPPPHHAPNVPPPAPELPPPAPRRAPDLPPPAPRRAPDLPPPAPKLPPIGVASLMSGPPSLETVVDRVPRYFPQEEEEAPEKSEKPVVEAPAPKDSESSTQAEAHEEDEEARKLAEAMKSHDLEVLDSLDIEVLTPSVDLEKDVVFHGLSDNKEEKQVSEPKVPAQVSSPVALESTLLLTDDIVKETLLPSGDVRSKSEIVEAEHLFMDDDDSRTRTNWEDDLSGIGDETVATMRNPFFNDDAQNEEEYGSIDISLEDNSESKAKTNRDDGFDNLHSWLRKTEEHEDVPLVANRVPIGNRGRIRKNSRLQAEKVAEIESAKTMDAFAVAEERTTHDVKLLDFFMEKAQTKPVIPPSELAEALYEEEETRERSHVDEARLQSLVNAVSTSSKSVSAEGKPERISSLLEEDDETRTRNGSEAAFISSGNESGVSEAPMRTLSPADLNAARAAIELAQKKLSQADKLDVHELREAANLVSSTFDAIVHSQINAVIEDNEHSSIRMYPGGGGEKPAKQEESKAATSEPSGSKPKVSQKPANGRADTKAPQADDASDEFDESVSEQFTIHSRDELEAMMRAFSEQEKRIQQLSGETESVSADEEVDEEPSSSEKLRVHKRLDMGNLDLASMDESDSVSINIPLASTRSIPPVQTGELRSLFEKEDELHILLANEIRTVESNCNKEAMKDEAINVRPKPGESNLSGNEPSEESSVKLEDTVQTSLPEASKTTENLIAQLLHNGEKQIARYGSFILTNRNIWYIEKSHFGLKNYESYDLKTVQSFALRQEHNWSLIIIDLLVIIAALIAGFVFYEDLNTAFYISVFLGGWAVLMLIVLYLVGYRTTLQIGVGTTVVKSRESVPRGEHLEAAKFLERLDRERVRVQKHARKAK